MVYCIKNHVLKAKVTHCPGWAIIGPGYICIRYEYAEKAEIKVCKNPEDGDFDLGKVIGGLSSIINKIPISPKIEKSIFTHDYPEMCEKSSFEWRIQTGKDTIYAFEAKQVGWALRRLRGEKLKWHVVPWDNGLGILVFTKAHDTTYVYAVVICRWSSEHEKIMGDVGRN